MQNGKVLRAVLCLAAFAVAAAQAPARATDWPRSDIAPDPAVKFGVLENGMRYALMANHTPAGAVSVRFNIDAGSMQEAADQRGLAHFVEHLAFRGSAHFPDGEIDKSLQRLGLRFGGDTNASTGQTQTTYWFDLPRSDGQSVATALAITRDIAGNLDLGEKAAATESGVILSELKLRDTPSYRSLVSELNFELADPHATAMPGGDPAIVAAAPIGRIRDFYHAFYRPDRATLIVVGDIDPAQVEAQIKQRFADWRGTGEPGADPAIHVSLTRGPEVGLFAEAGAPSTVRLTWLQPLDPKPTDRAHERAQFIDAVATAIVNRRLQQLAASPERPFLGARIGRGEAEKAAKLTSLALTFQGGNWKSALAAAEQVRLGALSAGVTQAELDRVVNDQHAALSNASLAAATRPTRGLVNALLSSASDQDIFTSPARDLAVIEQDIKGLSTDMVTAALRAMFGSAGPLIFISAPEPVEGGADAVKTAFAQIEKTAASAAPLQALAVTPWPYVDFGAPGKVVETARAADLDATFLRFANGVRLAVRPSKLRANQVLVSVKVGSGRLDLPTDRPTAAWLAGAFVQGGLKAMSYTDMQRALTGKTYRLGFGVGEDALVFSGGTTPGDIDTQLQVIAAYIRDPAFRPEAFAQFKSASVARRRQGDALPGPILQRQAPEILHAGDKRWASPTIEQIQAGSVDEVRALLTPAFANGPIDITITGDVDVDKVIAAVAATFGAFPARAQSRTPVSAANNTHFPAGAPAPIKLPAPEQSDQAIVTISWPTHGRFPDLRDGAVLQLLSAVMQDRLFNQLRGIGTVYVAQVGSAASPVFDYGYLQASSQFQPDNLAKFDQALNAIIAGLKDQEVTADELARAKTPALEELERSRQSNDYWLSVLENAQTDQNRLDLARKYEALLKSVSRGDLMAAARKYLRDDHAIKLLVGAG